MDLEKVGYGEIPNKLHAVIEIPFGSSIKYELDKDSGAIFVDRVLYSAMFYPANYGFIPNTLANDGDPADILVLSDHSFAVGSVIKCRLIGALIMEDESGMDEKLIAVPVTKVDPTFEKVKSYEDLSSAVINKIKNFFETYKMLEPNKWVKIKSFVGVDEAIKILDESILKAKNSK